MTREVPRPQAMMKTVGTIIPQLWKGEATSLLQTTGCFKWMDTISKQYISLYLLYRHQDDSWICPKHLSIGSIFLTYPVLPYRCKATWLSKWSHLQRRKAPETPLPLKVSFSKQKMDSNSRFPQPSPPGNPAGTLPLTRLLRVLV